MEAREATVHLHAAYIPEHRILANQGYKGLIDKYLGQNTFTVFSETDVGNLSGFTFLIQDRRTDLQGAAVFRLEGKPFARTQERFGHGVRVNDKVIQICSVTNLEGYIRS